MERTPKPASSHRPATRGLSVLGWAAAALLCGLALAWGYAAGPAEARAGSKHVHGAPDDADSAAELLGQPARAWSFNRWVDSPPLTQESLRGKVVLIRWFNTGCKYCGNTLPGLEALRTRYAAQGLVVIGVFHPKPIGKVNDAFARRTARKLGFQGPIAVDEDWSTLNRWWLANHADRNWTSVSFLMDREGVVRWAQGGGEYHPSDDPRHATCDASYAELERTIRRLLAERDATTSSTGTR